MAAYVKYQKFVEHLAEAKNPLDTATLKIMLTNTAPVAATDDVYGDISANEVASGNGYTTGGATVTVSASSQTGGTYKLVGSVPSPTWTAGPAAMGVFRYAVLYDSTSATKSLIGYWDYGQSVTLQNGDSFTITLDGTNGILQLA